MSTTPPDPVRAARPGRDHRDDKKSVFTLIGELPNLITTLIRDEIEQIRREAVTRLKTAGIGVGLFVGAAVFAYFALWVLIATAILGIATALPPWLSALIVGVALLLIAVVLGLLGLSRVKRGVPPVPKEAVDSVKDDVKAFKGVGHYDR
ncbi:phage holin family protein [Amnibacterium sp.]|uniref:phage holin family protein n=1 Tax=Amnibacterium sp. TaxID=1872496 RepID=UPI00262032C2|nr:phage holin family protein [Amnibacterium sp.]MCU1473415.1 putative integral rane protein [Amnibacterium sp.]